MNMHLPSRLAKVLDAADFLLAFENANRATEQSARTRDGQWVEPMPREVLSRELEACA